jgi:hypothetical protein
MKLISRARLIPVPILALVSVTLGCQTRKLNESSQTKSQLAASFLTMEAYKSEVPITRTEKVYSIEGAQIAIADYASLRSDYPFMKDLSDKQIDTYLLDSYGYFSAEHISFSQMHNVKVNEPIPVGTKAKEALRPPFYGRALLIPGEGFVKAPKFSGVFESLPVGPLMDVKGAGSAEPEEDEHFHGNGQAYLGEALREYHFQKLVQMVFDHANKGWKTNPVYAVIILPFSANHKFNTKLRSALIIRKAAFRHGPFTNHGGFLMYKTAGKINEDLLELSRERELLLRTYGLTTSVERDPGPSATERFDGVNMQFTNDASQIDFGGFGVLDRFTNPLKFINASYLGDVNQEKEFPLFTTGYQEDDPIAVVRTNDPGFVSQPRMELRVGQDMWGVSKVTQSAIQLLPTSMRPKTREQFLDNPSLAATALTFVFEKSIEEGRKAAFQQHCNLMVPVARKLGMSADRAPSLKGCEVGTDAKAFFEVQVQVAQTLSSLVNEDKLKVLLKDVLPGVNTDTHIDALKTLGTNVMDLFTNLRNGIGGNDD